MSPPTVLATLFTLFDLQPICRISRGTGRGGILVAISSSVKARKLDRYDRDIAQTPWERFQAVRAATESLCAPLSAEDASVSVTADTSPAKWHLAHTTWFFERFLLQRFDREYQPVHPAYDFLFNSYYESSHYLPKTQRPFLSRPSLAEILAYRAVVNERLEFVRQHLAPSQRADFEEILEIGGHHEQQHQELMLMDIKQNFFLNPLRPSYREGRHPFTLIPAHKGGFVSFAGGLTTIGARRDGFVYDNELGRHQVWIEPFQLARDLVTNGEYLQFIEEGGYDDPLYWLSDGWAAKKKFGWTAPLYWTKEPIGWSVMTLAGPKPLVPSDPVCHVSYFEAQAFARWRGVRLPTEFEWELAAQNEPVSGAFLESGVLQPVHEKASGELSGLHGSVWQWTQSAYLPYPRYQPFAHGLGEYNGKFFSNQMVLRGGSCVTPRGHYRSTYRNFYYPHMRWQFAGFRLAKDAV